MFLCNTSTRFLYDQMLVNMHLLSKFPFQLDIFHEAKLLHQSMNPSFISTKSNPTLPAMRKNPSKVSSRTTAASHVRKSTSADARIPKSQSKNSKYYANQLKKSQMKRSFSDERPKIPRAPQALPKSKTAQNIQNERNFSNSGVPRPLSYGLARFPSKPKISAFSSPSDGPADREKGMEPTKAQRPKSIEGDREDPAETNNKDPDRFRRLQMQWELLSNDEARKSPGGGASPNPALAGSKIPRPITSPIRTHQPAIPGSGPNVRPTSKR
ncbi:unnamed protein product [Allacma fusca]|uniref:Uncharacterized protein n=1 Tax=Allacma fusca TaxID=39272 RepID=A0A8J2K3R6_9HEXA|nr:unnamed protein product [Allacma fusca]